MHGPHRLPSPLDRQCRPPVTGTPRGEAWPDLTSLDSSRFLGRSGHKLPECASHGQCSYDGCLCELARMSVVWTGALHRCKSSVSSIPRSRMLPACCRPKVQREQRQNHSHVSLIDFGNAVVMRQGARMRFLAFSCGPLAEQRQPCGRPCVFCKPRSGDCLHVTCSLPCA